MTEPLVIGGHYKHYKNGKTYQLLSVARHTETLLELVIYQAQYNSQEFGDNAVWARPKAMFLEEIMHEGKKTPRFSYNDTTKKETDTNYNDKRVKEILGKKPHEFTHDDHETLKKFAQYLNSIIKQKNE